MKRLLGCLLVMGVVGCGSDGTSPAHSSNADPVAALDHLGARIERNEEGQVVGVQLPLKKAVTDAGLLHLKGLAQLQTLNLGATAVTDAGLVHLKGLTNLQRIKLNKLPVTDAGLVNLKNLTNLQLLDLYDTQATDAGVADLQKALPNCEISK